MVNCVISNDCHRPAASARAFSLLLPSRDDLMALPGKPGFLGDRVVAPLEESPSCTWGRGMRLYVKNAVASHAVNPSPPGQPWGLGRDALGFSHLTYCTAQRDSLHLLARSPSPYEINLPPDSRGVNNCICRDQKIPDLPLAKLWPTADIRRLAPFNNRFIRMKRSQAEN